MLSRHAHQQRRQRYAARRHLPDVLSGRALRLAGLLLVAACHGAPPAPAPHEVHYRLEWIADGAVRRADGAWELTNDLGYRVRLTRGFVTSYSMEVVECPRPSALVWPGLVAVAHAGHSAGTPNPAAIRPMQVESLTEPAAREVGAVRLQPQAYCQLHYLIARATREAAGLPSDLDMVDTSLHVEGISRASGASVDVPFMVHTPIANGRVFDRAGDGPIRVDTGRAGVRVAVRRHLARMFDGVEFTRMTPQLIGEQILTSLLAHVDVTIDALDGGGPADAGPPR